MAQDYLENIYDLILVVETLEEYEELCTLDIYYATEKMRSGKIDYSPGSSLANSPSIKDYIIRGEAIYLYVTFQQGKCLFGWDKCSQSAYTQEALETRQIMRVSDFDSIESLKLLIKLGG